MPRRGRRSRGRTTLSIATAPTWCAADPTVLMLASSGRDLVNSVESCAVGRPRPRLRQVTGELLTLLGFTITAMPRRYRFGFQGPRPEYTMNVWSIMERVHYHYLSPRMMLAAHWRALHEKLDRMIAAGDSVGIRRWQEVVSAPIHLRMTHLVTAIQSITERHILPSKRCTLHHSRPQDFEAHRQRVMERKRQLADDICGEPQHLDIDGCARPPCSSTHSMRDHIDEYMRALWAMQSAVASMFHGARRDGRLATARWRGVATVRQGLHSWSDIPRATAESRECRHTRDNTAWPRWPR